MLIVVHETMKTLPTEAEVRKRLMEIINRYFSDEVKREEMLTMAKWDQPPVRGIFSDLHQMGVTFEQEDEDAIHSIFFYFG